MLLQSGTLLIKCINAKLTHDTETFGKMDPYVVVTIGGRKEKTRTHENGGKNPRWGETLRF